MSVVHYQYESHQGDGSLYAHSDEEALGILKKKFGPDMNEVILVYVELSEMSSRTVWISDAVWAATE